MRAIKVLSVVVCGLGLIAACDSDADTPPVPSGSEDAAAGDEAGSELPDGSAGEVPDGGPSETPDATPGETDGAAGEVLEGGPGDASTDPPDAMSAMPDGASSELPDGSSSPLDATPGELVDAMVMDAAAGGKSVLDLNDVSANPDSYEWFDFRPNLLKLILSGAAETEHIAILWYTVEDGAVGLHYHSQTESVYAIDGTQTDAEGVYPTGTVYFNPPGSGHEITDSTGFFILAYASPPDFANTDLIEEYTPVIIDTEASDLMTAYPFEEQFTDVSKYEIPLDAMGGMTAELLESASVDDYSYVGNYVLVLGGSCVIDSVRYGENTLVVATTIEPQPFTIAAPAGETCLAMALSF